LDNILLLCLDSVRYDTFMRAETPNFSKVGNVCKAHSFACWTVPSMMGYLMGYPPIGTGRRTLFPHHKLGKASLAPEFFLKEGYVTAWLSSNGFILKLDRALRGAISRWFKHYENEKYLELGCTATREIFNEAKSIVENEGEKPIFMVILEMATHLPYHAGERTLGFDPRDPDRNFDNQVRAIGYVDSVSPALFNAFRGTGNATTVIITSDHGDLLGPDWGHDPSSNHFRFHQKLFEIPFIRGELK
jgi:hypothetical protein